MYPGSPDVRPFRTRDNRTLSVWHWPEQPDRPTLHWAHATGFNALTYTPLFNRLTDRFNIKAWDMRGHGTSQATPPIDAFTSWSLYYNDLTDWLEAAPEPVVLGGHSIGATTSLIAAAQVPDKVRGVVACDPVLIHGPVAWLAAAAKRIGFDHWIPLAKTAAARRRTFPSRQAVFDKYKNRGAFKTWPDEWLEAYIEAGFVETPTGEVTLACTPEWESRNFALTEHRALHRLAGLTVPVHLLLSARDSTTWPGARRALAKRFESVFQEEIEGSSHFIPMEYPDRVIQALSAMT